MPNSARIDELQKKFNENPRRYFAPLADELRKAGDLQGAIELCRSHLAQQPGHMSGHIVLGKALYEGGELDEARQTFETALGLDPENLIALRHLGDIARQQGDAYGARQWYQRVLDADPRNEEIAAQIQLLDEMPATEAFGAGAAAAPAAELVPDLAPELANAPDTLAESTVPDGTLPPALEPSAIAYLAEEPTLEVPAYRTAPSASRAAAAELLDLDMSALDAPASPAAPAARSTNDIGLESMEFIAPSRDEQASRAEGLERPDYDFDPHVVDGSVHGEATPAAFVTETMAELYLQQGFTDEALQVYRQLLAANPADANLRARVQQLEGGARSTLGFDVSEDVVRAAQERRSRGNRPTARRFFASLAARRGPPRAAASHDGYGEAGAAGAAGAAFGTTMDVDHADAAPADAALVDPYGYGATGAETNAMDAAALIAAHPDAGGPSDVAFDTPDAQAYDAPQYDAQQYDATAYEGAAGEAAAYDTAEYDAAPYEAAQYGQPLDATEAGVEPGDAFDTTAWDAGTAAPDIPEQSPASEFDVAAYERESWDEAQMPAPAPPAAPAEGGHGGVTGTVDALFGGASGATSSDEAAANALAGVFAGTPAALPAVRPAAGELSLDQVFRETPRRADSQRRDASGFSFDQFFSEGQSEQPPAAPAQPPAQGSGPGEGGENDEQFNAWLEGLKQK